MEKPLTRPKLGLNLSAVATQKIASDRGLMPLEERLEGIARAASTAKAVRGEVAKMDKKAAKAEAVKKAAKAEPEPAKKVKKVNVRKATIEELRAMDERQINMLTDGARSHRRGRLTNDDVEIMAIHIPVVAACLPLAVGISEEIEVRLAGVMSRVRAKRAIHKHTRSEAYINALRAEGSMRHDIDCNPVGPVSEKERAGGNSTRGSACSETPAEAR